MAYFGYEPSKVAVSVGQGVITSVELGTDAVNTIDILNDAVTPAKIDDDGTGFQMGTLGLGGAVSGAEKLTVTGTASFSGAITGNLTGNASGTSATVTGASQSAITSVGTLTSLTTSGVVLGADGSTSAPSFSFSSDTNTGVYRVSADTLGITASGNRQVRFFDGDTYFDSRIYAHVGSVGNPSYCFNDDTDTGIYKVASNQIGIATNGTRRIKIDASGETAIEGTLITSGSATFAGSLTVHGDAHINDDNTDGRIYISSRGTGDAGHFIRGSDQNLSLNAGGSTGQFRFEINGGAWLSTDNSGNATFSSDVTMESGEFKNKTITLNSIAQNTNEYLFTNRQIANNFLEKWFVTGWENNRPNMRAHVTVSRMGNTIACQVHEISDPYDTAIDIVEDNSEGTYHLRITRTGSYAVSYGATLEWKCAIN